MEEKKVITTESLQVAVDKIKADYPTKTEVTKQIKDASLGGNITYATEADVLAMFEDVTGE